MDLEPTAGFLGVFRQSPPILVEFLLVGSAHVTKPLSVRLDASCLGIGGPFLHLLHVWLCLVHVKSVYRRPGSELRARFSTRGVRTVRVATCFALFECTCAGIFFNLALLV